MIAKIKTRLEELILQKEGGKAVLNKKRILILVVITFVIATSIKIIPFFFNPDLPKGRVVRSDKPLVKDKNEIISMPVKSENMQSKIGGIKEYSSPTKKVVSINHYQPIRYRGKQVFTSSDPIQKLPSGANFIGKLLTSIDTRSPQRVSVILPYGAGHKSENGGLPPETILMGQFNYTGSGDRVFITFNKAVLPEGQEVAIQAEALSSKDYTVGVSGDYHGNKGNQMASVLGLSMVGGISEVMIEKQELGQSYNPTPKPTIKNGIYNGIAKITENEANNQIAELAQTPKYVTIDSGTDLIVSLIASVGASER